MLPLNHLGSSADVAGYGALMAAVMRPLGSAGTVRLASDDPTVDPIVEFNLLREPADLDEMVSGANLVLDLLRREPFRAVAREVYVDDYGTSWTALSDPERLVRVGPFGRRRVRARDRDLCDGNGRRRRRHGGRVRQGPRL